MGRQIEGKLAMVLDRQQIQIRADVPEVPEQRGVVRTERGRAARHGTAFRVARSIAASPCRTGVV